MSRREILHELPYAQGLHYQLIFYRQEGLACTRFDPRGLAQVEALVAASYETSP